ncbi:hypothetical protein COO60DRAFT_1645229 [Scenedesmus sp. NREL 46B-D3]|nr:hypothetical protein COO60DRAFT_1645229 [Scenedesmus sp. NREL 46B-D3]
MCAHPTSLLQDPAVRDGPWNAVDAGLVQAAQTQASTLHDSAGSSSTNTTSSSSATSSSSSSGSGRVVLLGQTPEQLGELAKRMGQPAYRGKQLADGILKGARRIAGLPASFVAQLQEAGVTTGRSVVHHTVQAPDGTSKLLLQLAEGRLIEAVGIPAPAGSRERLTVCVSSQVGCPMRCTFCATGKGGFARNLAAHEILDQVLAVSEVHGLRASNVGEQRKTDSSIQCTRSCCRAAGAAVFMGMGEPLLNLPNVVAAVAMLQQQLGMSGRAITISTVGVPNAINRLAQHKLTATLAVSLHAPNQELRQQLVPSGRLLWDALMQDCAAYFRATGRRARELLALLRRHKLLSHVNLIPWNPVGESEFRRPSRARVAAFKAVLEGAGLPVSVRTTRGLEAAAACGQLRNMYQKQGLSNPQPLL